MPSVVANRNNTYPSTSKKIEKSPLNETDGTSMVLMSWLFICKLYVSIAARTRAMIVGEVSQKYLKKSLDNLAAQKGKISSVC